MDRGIDWSEQKTGAVGAVGIMLDHFNMAHIDVMRDEKFGDHKLKEWKKKGEKR